MVDAITARDADFAQWYTDVCRKAELMDYSDAKGFIIYRPYGFADVYTQSKTIICLINYTILRY